MSLEDRYPSLTDMLDRYFRPLGEGDAMAVDAFLFEEGDAGREAVLAELRELLATENDPFELRTYLMIHRFDMIPDAGAEAWFASLVELLERAVV